jgi:hypothetical protein
MPLSKAGLRVLNNTNFPNNTTQYISPELLREFNGEMITALQLTQSMSEYAVISGGNNFIGNQNITGDLTVTGTLTVPIIHTLYETASVIYSSGSNQLGDELTDTQTLSGSVKVQGSLTINGVSVLAGQSTGSSLITASVLNNVITFTKGDLSQFNITVNTGSSNYTDLTSLNAYTASNDVKWNTLGALTGSYATTGSNTFVGNQIIDKTKALYTNALYWTSSEVGYNNLEIINQGGGNLDFASLNGGKMRIVNTPLILTGSALTSSNDISTSANIYAANLTGSATIPAGTISSSAQITSLGFVSSSVTASSLITASVNLNTITFTKGNGNTFAIIVNTGSAADLTSLNAFTASQLTINTGYNTFTQSAQQSINSLNAATSSYAISSSVAAVDAAQQSQINSLISATGSYVTSAITASSLITASFSGNTLTFTKGDSSTFGVVIPDVSGSTIPAGTISSSAQITGLGFVSSSITASSLVTASVNLNTITFTKGDASTFNITVNTGSGGGGGSAISVQDEGTILGNATSFNFNGSGVTATLSAGTASITIPGGGGSIDTGSFATTGSNTFVGNQIISGTITTTQDITISSVKFGFGNSAGTSSIAIGNSSTLQSNTGQYNIAIGPGAAAANTTGYQNIFIGLDAAANNTTGNSNTAIGSGTFRDNISGSNNFFFGAGAGLFAGSVNNSVAIGNQALLNVKGDDNLAIGNNTGVSITTGIANTLIGKAAGSSITTGNYNTLIGTNAGEATWNNVIAFSDGQGNIRTQYSGSGWTFTGSVDIQNTLTASLQQGYVWVGNASGRTTTVATSSFGGGGTTDTGSLMVTGSIAGNILTFTKGDASTFNLTIPSATGSVFDTGSFATTGSNTFTGQQNFTTTASPAIRISGSGGFGYGIELTGGSGLKISGPGGPRLEFPNGTWFNGNESDAMQFTGDTDNPLTRGLDFFLYGSGSRQMSFRNNSGTGATIAFSLNSGSMTFNAGQSIALTGSTIRLQGFTYPTTDGTSGQVLTTNGSKTLSFTTVSGGGGDTGSLMRTGSVSGNVLTFTKGDATTFSLTVATGSASSINTGSFATTGSNNFKGLQSIGDVAGTSTGEVYLLGRSGSLIITNHLAAAGGPSYAMLSNITSSQLNDNTCLIFKTISNSTGSLLLQGKSNIFTIPTSPANLTYQKYIGGSNNLYLQSQGGVTTLLTSSAATISGAKPTMNNNIFNGTQNFTINQAVNPGSHTYSNNIDNGTTTINAMAFTGSLTLSNNINNNGTITVNAASASFAEIASGLSGSHTISVTGNGIFGGQIIFTTNRNQPSNISHTLSNNLLAGGAALQIINPSSSVAIQASNNITNGTISYTNAGAAGLALHRNAAFVNTNYGPLNLIASASAINAQSNICSTALTVTNRMYSGSLGSGSVGFNNNSVQGAVNTYTVSGSYNGTGQGTIFANNAVYGSRNTFFTNVEGRGNYVNFSNNGIFGNSLILTGSNNSLLIEEGGAHIGRWNADDGRRNTTGENIFSVGTGTSTARKTGFLIDSGSNTFVEGTLNVSGSTSLTGSLSIQSGSALPSATGSSVLTWNATTGQVGQSTFTNLLSASLSIGEFYNSTTLSGSAGVSQSVYLPTTGVSNGLSIQNNSQIVTTQTGTYNIQFSAQCDAFGGADTIWIWFKKNGVNIADSASKLIMQNNTAAIMTVNIFDNATAGDYYEVVWQNNAGTGILVADAASGNIPAVPSVIVTINEIR